jgi:hypothetical protein
MAKPDAALPIVLIAFGTIWLLWALDWIPDVRAIAGWVLIGGGVAMLMIDGITKKSVVGGPFLIALGLLWFAHLEWRTPYRVLGPVAVIVLGVLMLVARLPMIPERRGSARTGGPTPGDPPDTLA